MLAPRFSLTVALGCAGTLALGWAAAESGAAGSGGSGSGAAGSGGSGEGAAGSAAVGLAATGGTAEDREALTRLIQEMARHERGRRPE